MPEKMSLCFDIMARRGMVTMVDVIGQTQWWDFDSTLKELAVPSWDIHLIVSR